MALPVELPVSKHFSADRIGDIALYVERRLDALANSWQDLREKKITQWRRIYLGKPREPSKSFPWQNASNVVIQLVGSYTDQCLAKWLMAIFGISPLWEVGVVGNWKRQERAEEQRAALQDHLGFVGIEPGYLNLLPKYEAWGSTTIRYGLGVMKLMPERRVERVAASAGSNGTITFENFTRHAGPTALPLLFEDFLQPLTIADVERAPFDAQRARLSRFALEAMLYDKTYDKEAVKAVLTTPDREGPEKTDLELRTDQGTQMGDQGGPASAEWDIWECWFPYRAAGRTFSLIWTYHRATKRTLKAVFNWLPDNSSPFVKAHMGFDGERSTGLGFCEMLADYQEEVTAIHNRRNDAGTLANTNIIRIGTGTQVDSQFSIYPNAIWSLEKDQLEIMPMGRTMTQTIQDEQMTLQLASDRAGIGPSSSGMGAGTVNRKGAYSAMGTYSVMQEGDTRSNLTKTSFKHAHYELGRLYTLFVANFGLAERDLKLAGEARQALEKALENIMDRRLALPIRAATGSINKEVEKQNLMLLLNNHRAHWQQQAQLLQALQSPMMSPDQKDYLWQTFQAANLLMARIDKDFGISDPSSILPMPATAEAQAQAAHDAALHAGAAQLAQQLMQQRGGPQIPGAPQLALPGAIPGAGPGAGPGGGPPPPPPGSGMPPTDNKSVPPMGMAQ